MPGKLIIAVEQGWQSSRELSLLLAKRFFSVDILIKGFVEEEALDMITSYSNISIESVARLWYRLNLFFKIINNAYNSNLKGILVEGKKIEKWLCMCGRVFKCPVFLIQGNEVKLGQKVFHAEEFLVYLEDKMEIKT